MRTITYKGETLSISEWAARTGINYFALAKRFEHGWSVERALTQPLGRQGIKRTRTRRQSLVTTLPALNEWQHDMHAAHRQLTRSIRLFVRDIEQQMAELRHHLDQNVSAQLRQACRGVGTNFAKHASDRDTPVAQESV